MTKITAGTTMAGKAPAGTGVVPSGIKVTAGAALTTGMAGAAAITSTAIARTAWAYGTPGRRTALAWAAFQRATTHPAATVRPTTLRLRRTVARKARAFHLAVSMALALLRLPPSTPNLGA